MLYPFIYMHFDEHSINSYKNQPNKEKNTENEKEDIKRDDILSTW